MHLADRKLLFFTLGEEKKTEQYFEIKFGGFYGKGNIIHS
jgi:hypothetical protein